MYQDGAIFNDKLYKNDTYISKYGGSVFLTVGILVIFIKLIIQNSLACYVKSLKKRWPEIKCNPLILPFAGYINAPPETSNMDYTASNFTECLDDILEDVTKLKTEAIRNTSAVMNDGIGDMHKVTQNTRQLISKMRKSSGGTFKSTQGKIFNVMTPLKSMLTTSKNTIGKIHGIATANLYTSMGIGIFGKSFANAIQIALIIFVVVIFLFIGGAMYLAVMLMFTFVPVTFIPGLAALSIPTAVFFFVIIGLGVILETIILAGEVIETTSLCFDKDTPIYVKGKGEIKIKDVKLNDCLIDGGHVTALFKVANKNQEIYNLNGVIVSGRHMIECENNSFIDSKEHKNSKKMENYNNPYLYCLNTTTKRIIIKTIKFLDWDELDYDDEAILKEKTQIKNIHKYLDSGLDGETMFAMKDGSQIPLKNVKVNDILKGGEHVLGKVVIDSSNVNVIQKYNIDNTSIICTPNTKIKIKDLGIITLSQIKGTYVNCKKKLYNIITDTKTYTVGGIKFLDYNGALEPIIWSKEFPPEIY